MEPVVDMRKRMRMVMVTCWLIVLSFVLIALFWYNEYQYSLPTPKPANYKDVSVGAPISLGHKLSFKNHKPVFLHFFNPDCPCSRFNIKHFRSLVNQYGNQVNFAVVLMTGKNYTPEEIQGKLDLNVPVLKDMALASRCGVYSTPQAVVITDDSRLYFRGNYNRSRYCNDKSTEYARIALQGLLQNRAFNKFDSYALMAYGCQLPGCKQ